MQRVVYVYNTQLPEVMASVRLVALVPARYLGCRALFFGPGMDANAFLERHRPNVLVFTKAVDDSIVTLARAAVSRGVAVITTLCDLHFSGEHGRRNKELCDLSRSIVVQTAPMAAEVQRQFGRTCVIIEEALEYPRLEPRFSPKWPLRVLWYGESTNYDTLFASLPALATARIGPIELTLVSNAIPDFASAGISRLTDITLKFVPWSQMIQFQQTSECDLVFIPSIDSPKKQVKGHNRLVEAINGGRLAIVHPLPQYLELADYCLCSADYAASIRAALANPAAVLKRIESGQRYIDGRFSQEVVAEKWRKLFEATDDAPSAQPDNLLLRTS
jgi:hypothetical protein